MKYSAPPLSVAGREVERVIQSTCRESRGRRIEPWLCKRYRSLGNAVTPAEAAGSGGQL